MGYAIISAADLVAKFQYALDNKWGYIYGRAGVLWTKKDQEAMNTTTSDIYEQARKYGKKWINHYVADCSGLFSWAFNELGSYIYHGSDTIWRQYCAKRGELVKGKREDGEELLPGTAVFEHKAESSKRTHIGLYIGNGNVIEAAGTQKGVIVSKVKDPKWNEWGELKCVSMDDKVPVDMNPTLKRGMKGTYVTTLQEKLNTEGYSVGEVDGIFGRRTEAAVKDFQLSNGLTADGIVGDKTWAVLNAEMVKPAKTYTVTIEGLTQEQVVKLRTQYPQAVVSK